MIKLNDSISVRLFSIPVRLQNKDGTKLTRQCQGQMRCSLIIIVCTVDNLKVNIN